MRNVEVDAIMERTFDARVKVWTEHPAWTDKVSVMMKVGDSSPIEIAVLEPYHDQFGDHGEVGRMIWDVTPSCEEVDFGLQGEIASEEDLLSSIESLARKEPVRWR